MREESFDSFYRATRRRACCTRRSRSPVTSPRPSRRSATRTSARGSTGARSPGSTTPSTGCAPVPGSSRSAGTRARIWHRNKGLSAEHRPCSTPSSELPVAQRRVLLLVDLAGLDLDPRRPRARRDPRRRGAEPAAARPSASPTARRDPTVARRRGCVGLDALLDDAALPRGPLLRATAAASTAGAAWSARSPPPWWRWPPGRSPTSRARARRRAAPRDRPRHRPSDGPRGRGPHRRATCSTATRSAGSGRPSRGASPGPTTTPPATASTPSASRTRFADPTGYAALVRTFAAAGAADAARAVQTVEVSRPRAGRRPGFRTTVGWYAGCRVGRLQVLDSYRVDDVGDEADVLTLRVWTRAGRAPHRRGRPHRPADHLDGRHHRRRAARRRHGRRPALGGRGRDAVRPQRAGRLREAPTAAPYPRRRRATSRGILAVADLPPVGRWTGPGSAPGRRRPRANPSATTCDRADFAKAGATRARTRTYLIPEASLPARFGLSETYGGFRTPRAAAGSWPTVRGTVAGCEKRDLATKVGGEQRTRAAVAAARTSRTGTSPPRSTTRRRSASGWASSGSATRSRS